MTFGNLAALRQTNIVRMLAYSSIAQGGFMLVPFAAAGIAGANGRPEVAAQAMSAVVIYLFIYGAMNLGAFAVVIAVARRTGSAEISSYSGLFQTSPVLAVTMTLFLASLAGIPPLAGWFAKFVMFRSIIDAGTGWGVALACDRGGQLGDRVLLLLRRRAADVVRASRSKASDRTPIRVPPALAGAIALTARGRGRDRHLPAAVRADREIERSSRRRPPTPIAALIRREGAITFDRFVELALYEPAVGSSRPDTARAAPGATSSRARRSARCSARACARRSTCWRGLG